MCVVTVSDTEFHEVHTARVYQKVDHNEMFLSPLTKPLYNRKTLSGTELPEGSMYRERVRRCIGDNELYTPSKT